MVYWKELQFTQGDDEFGFRYIKLGYGKISEKNSWNHKIRMLISDQDMGLSHGRDHEAIHLGKLVLGGE